MNFGIAFFLDNILLGAALAADAFSVSLANGMNEPRMKAGKMSGVAGIFAFFQFAMPMIGWVCVSTVAQYFAVFEKCIPWIALVLLGFLGGKMLYEGIKERDGGEDKPAVGLVALLLQGVGTSIDALSAGFTISSYTWLEALVACLLIGLVTFVLCLVGITAGKQAGTRLAGKAGILGGAILIFFGLKIFVQSFF